MNSSTIKSILNPIRLRIIHELSLQKQATTKEISESLSDVPQATLYRHIAALLKQKVISVVEEHKIKGITEKVYSLNGTLGNPANIDVDKLTKKNLEDMFTQYIIGLLSDFNQCISAAPNIDACKTKLGFRSSSLYLTDEEMNELMLELHNSLMKRMENKSAPNRKLRKISTVLTTASCKE